MDYTGQVSTVPKIKRALVSLHELSWLHWWSPVQILLKNYLILHFLQAFCSSLIISRLNWFSPPRTLPQLSSPVLGCDNACSAWSALHFKKPQILKASIIPFHKGGIFWCSNDSSWYKKKKKVLHFQVIVSKKENYFFNCVLQNISSVWVGRQ